VPSYPAVCFPKKLNNTKLALLKWNSLHFGNIHKKIKETLHLIDIVQQTTPSSSSFEQEISLKMDLDNLLIKKESLWRSKSRETWLTCKDLNTKYFHTSTLIKRRSNAINFLKLDSGVWVSSRDEIGGNFISHFSNLFTTTNPLTEVEKLDLFSLVVIEVENEGLCVIPAEVEILEALASMGSTKAPGPDGFTTLFYKKYWQQVRLEVLLSIEFFFTNNNLPRGQNHSFIALVPKQSGSHIVHRSGQ
jgi:hypothetical protein